MAATSRLNWKLAEARATEPSKYIADFTDNDANKSIQKYPQKQENEFQPSSLTLASVVLGQASSAAGPPPSVAWGPLGRPRRDIGAWARPRWPPSLRLCPARASRLERLAKSGKCKLDESGIKLAPNQKSSRHLESAQQNTYFHASKTYLAGAPPLVESSNIPSCVQPAA